LLFPEITAFGIRQWLGKTKQIICGHLKETAQSLNIFKAWLIPIFLQIGYLPLCHVDRIA